MEIPSTHWTPTSWKSKDVHQDVLYQASDAPRVEKVLDQISHLPPIVVREEIGRLRNLLAEVSDGKRFLLQGGDCAELFAYCDSNIIERKLRVLLQMSLILVWGGRTPVVRIGRIAGQYAKPRSKPTEIVNGKEHIAWRGDNVNGVDLDERNPDPERLLQAYFHSAATTNYIRALCVNGFADLNHQQSFNLGFVKNEHLKKEYSKVVDHMNDSLHFMKTIGTESAESKTVDFFTSHEGLMLDYESVLTREYNQQHYNVGAHFLWIGDRTRQLTGAHVEYFRGIHNPIGVKVGPSMKPHELVELLDILDSNFEKGKITLITRYGVDKISDYLPLHIEAVKQTKHQVVWCCDPMHGNTEQSGKFKTRHFHKIQGELSKAFVIHKQNGSHLGGVHLELTGDEAVTECVGGSMDVLEADLATNYATFCDPRLNYEQSLDIAFLISKTLEERRK
ncbi:3-deoxy-7-phosphoheptulonate synthase [Synchytrium microbalum]|uniref:Phospho-2-dehydro-3-deoxyheptonate aldolase n=1 Tax=Synchytrium microbalum TaxID=1806994 RepID=A0A507C6U2_9FUNG|nr:3-deoxy-7-phosphoheptulonate synthase [Synchytrium microbalum]TPX35221.1 3-deoxy-7-phosphoheptulonate synthase [Synchytrium microbalum]